MAVAQPDYASFQALYPALASKVGELAYNALFAQAGLYIDNTDLSPIVDPVARTSLMNIAVAHLASLTPSSAAVGVPLAGRITSATEGSVSVQSTLEANGIPAFWAQTALGIAFWQAMAPYRTAVYVAPPPYDFEPYPFAAFGQGFGGGWPWQP